MSEAEEGRTQVVAPATPSDTSSSLPRNAPEIHGYRMIRRLGEGGMAEVYLAEDLSLGRQVAIKVMTSELLSDPGFRSRFEHEARLLAGFRHRYIVTVYASGEVDGHPYIAMEYVPGKTLDERLKENNGKLPAAEAVRVARRIADALSYAHERNVIHRDIKPSNILFTDEHTPVLADFGIAKSLEDIGSKTKTGFVVGSPRYMAPEQLAGRPVSDKIDIYAIGLVLYEMLEGSIPDWVAASIHGKDDRRKLRQQLSPANRRYADLIASCLAADPEERPTARALTADLFNFSRSSKETITRWLAGTAVALVAVAGAMLFWNPFGLLNTTVNGMSTADQGDSGEVKKKIAVLPFEYVGNDENQRFLVEGMTVETIIRLSRMDPGKLAVIGAGTTATYRNSELSTSQIGEQLEVDYVLKGTVQFGGDSMRVTAELTRTSDLTNVWVDSWDQANAEDIFSLRDQLANKIASSLSINLLSAPEQTGGHPAQVEPEAFTAYVKGRSLWEERSADKLLRAKLEFERAIEIDRNYGAAYAGLADTYNMLARYGVMSQESAFDAATENARRAIDIDATQPEGHVALAYALMHQKRDWKGAEAAFKRALQLDPSYPLAWQWYGRMLSALGRHEEAVASVARAVELEPGLAVVRSALCQAQYYARQFADAAATCSKALSLDPGFARAHSNLSRVLEQQGDWAEAKAHVHFGQDGIELPPTVVEARGSVSTAPAQPAGATPFRFSPESTGEDPLLRFDDASPPESGYVERAHLQFSAAADHATTAGVSISISSSAESGKGINRSRTDTTPTVLWKIQGGWRAGDRTGKQRTPDLSELLNHAALTSVGGQSSGLSLVLRIVDSAGQSCSSTSCNGPAAVPPRKGMPDSPALEIVSYNVPGSLQGISDLICIEKKQGHEARSRLLLERMHRPEGEQQVSAAYAFAEAYACVGDADRSLEWLLTASEASDPSVLLIAAETRFERVLQDPAFSAAVRSRILRL